MYKTDSEIELQFQKAQSINFSSYSLDTHSPGSIDLMFKNPEDSSIFSCYFFLKNEFGNRGLHFVLTLLTENEMDITIVGNKDGLIVNLKNIGYDEKSLLSFINYQPADSPPKFCLCYSGLPVFPVLDEFPNVGVVTHGITVIPNNITKKIIGTTISLPEGASKNFL